MSYDPSMCLRAYCVHVRVHVREREREKEREETTNDGISASLYHLFGGNLF